MKRKALIVFAATTLVLSVSVFKAFSAEHQHHQGGPNALVEEMGKLDSAFREIVSAVALGDGARVKKAIETMHGTMEKTQESLHAGHVELRKNASKAHEFERLDRAFHKDLEGLSEAASKNDTKAMVSKTKKLLDGCVACHSRFRP